jgi:hypothetical protein
MILIKKILILLTHIKHLLSYLIFTSRIYIFECRQNLLCLLRWLTLFKYPWSFTNIFLRITYALWLFIYSTWSNPLLSIIILLTQLILYTLKYSHIPLRWRQCSVRRGLDGRTISVSRCRWINYYNILFICCTIIISIKYFILSE